MEPVKAPQQFEAFQKEECAVSIDSLIYSMDNQHASSLAYKSHKDYQAAPSGFKPTSGSYKLVTMQAAFTGTQHTYFSWTGFCT